MTRDAFGDALKQTLGVSGNDTRGAVMTFGPLPVNAVALTGEIDRRIRVSLSHNLLHLNWQYLLYGVVAIVHDAGFTTIDFLVSQAVKQSIVDGLSRVKVDLVIFRFDITYRFKGGAHANFIVINKRTGEIEHYDPWGEGAHAAGVEGAIRRFFQTSFVPPIW